MALVVIPFARLKPLPHWVYVEACVSDYPVSSPTILQPTIFLAELSESIPESVRTCRVQLAWMIGQDYIKHVCVPLNTGHLGANLLYQTVNLPVVFSTVPRSLKPRRLRSLAVLPRSSMSWTTLIQNG